MWRIIKLCWESNPRERLTANEAVIRLCRLPSRPRDTRPPGEWDSSVLSHLRSSMMEYPFSPSAENVHAHAAFRGLGGEGDAASKFFFFPHIVNRVARGELSERCGEACSSAVDFALGEVPSAGREGPIIEELSSESLQDGLIGYPRRDTQAEIPRHFF
jgi:hypothetical protein